MDEITVVRSGRWNYPKILVYEMPPAQVVCVSEPVNFSTVQLTNCKVQAIRIHEAIHCNSFLDIP